jgi:hypothetical protein
MHIRTFGKEFLSEENGEAAPDDHARPVKTQQQTIDFAQI